MSDKYTVFGNPIKQSRSPLIHGEFAKSCGQIIDYSAMEIPLDDFAAVVKGLFESELSGANVTVPFKEQAFEICVEVSERAQRAGAVNTLIKTDAGDIHGDNTDGVGLVRDLLNKQVVLAGARILLLGAGGASRGVILPLLAESPSELVITNRTLSKAHGLVNEFDDTRFSACDLAELSGSFDVIINATSAGLSGHVPPVPVECLRADTVCYDMVYGADVTAFNRWAMDNGVEVTFDGLGMLVEQAAESFSLWRGVTPDTQPVLKLLREQLTL